jgi:hypothetical protein
VERGGRRGPSNLERKNTIPEVLTIWIVNSKSYCRRSGAGRVVSVVDGSIYEGVDGGTCSRRHGISSCAYSLTEKLTQVISESRSAIAKEPNESARSKGRKTGGRERGTEKGGKGVVGSIP